jgi:hypothetical protein
VPAVHRPLRLLAVLVFAAALAGCKAQGPERAMARFSGDPAARSQAMAASAAAAGRAAQPAHAARASQTSTGDAGPDGVPGDVQRAKRPDAAATPPAVDARPERFLGLDTRALRGELGKPALVRGEGPARVWQYRGRTCVLDLVFYPAAGGRAVRHLEARDPVDAEPLETAACLRDLLRQRAVAASG